MIEKNSEKLEKEEFEAEEDIIEEPTSEDEDIEEAIVAEFEDGEGCGTNEACADDKLEQPSLNTSSEGLNGLNLYMRQIGQYGNLSAEEEKRLGEAAHNGDAAAREKLVNHNLRLVVCIAKKYAGHGVSIEDLIAYGNLGLMEAVDRFDFSKGFKLTTYASYWIRMEIGRGLQKMRNMVTKPDHVINAMSAVSKVSNSLQNVLMREPTSEEISMAMNGKFTEGQVDAIKGLMMNGTPVSLDKQLDAEDSASDTIGDLVADENNENPEEYAMRINRDKIMADVIADLKPQFRTIIRMRYGIGVEPGSETKIYTLDEIAEQLMVEGFTNKTGGRYTKEYVRQLENNALATMKADPRIAALEGEY